MTPFVFHRNAVGVAILSLASLAAGAQQAEPAPADAAPTLKEITVTGNPLGGAELIAPTTSLSGEALLLRSQSTLGETLDGLPGVSSSYFGPNASRPIVRGQDGDRIRILQNGGGAPDASALSYDHAVPVDALVTERVEVLRGPSALQYGGSAVGGVVNIIDNRIPSEPINGFGGRADLGYATGNKEKNGGVVLEGGNDRYALHVDAFDRRSDDVAVPIELGCSKPGSPWLARRICNSANEARGGAIGGSLFFDQGYIGASASTYRSTYGTVAEDDVTIGMKSDRYALEGEWRPGGFFTSVHAKLSSTDYRHTEYEGGTAGTTFANKSSDLRIEARHQKIGNLEGLIGFTSERNRFSADGEEAFAPHSRTRANALFVHEELGMPWGKLSFGARTEQVKVTSLGYPADPEITRFAVGERSFNPHSAALGALVNLTPQWQLTSNLAYTERAPKDYELFANGPHVATAAWEVGDPSLQKERSVGFDLGAQWKSGANRAGVNAYVTRFRNYIGLTASGNQRDEEGNVVTDPAATDTLAEYVYSGVRARFTGIEASGNLQLLGRDGFARASDGSTLDLEWRGDLVRATNTDTGEPLPRIAPVRVGATLVYGNGPWSARFGFDHNAAQHRVPLVGARETDAYTLWNASISYRMKVQRAALTWYARVDNITNKLAYTATSILTTTVYPDAPLPGRTLKVGLRVNF
ncbi:TonB-dependent receptor [Variovorax sp. J22G21]|uniref:TonB-dependent receptor n=1 Tax=Variovorax fucosicus TaxID=3053517 RepID=UPI002577C42D|nr:MULTISPECIES: TonB-dependent receptor [unclassified Variovorax]MDM0040789.1 TonB-dependent receptor [Variovorax sp. J22R193]MDM0062162.1 TonB-dependent receptor [Variovorax sp. J22G21]